MKQLLFAILLMLQINSRALGEPLIASIDVVLPNANPVLANVANDIKLALQPIQPSLPITIHSISESVGKNSKNTLVITVGENLLPWLATEKDNYAAVLAFSVSSIEYYPKFHDQKKITALFRDQPLSRQLQLAKLILPNLRRVGIIVGHKGLPIGIAELEHGSQLEIQSIDIEDKPDWPKYLSQLVADNDVLLGVDDPNIYNAESIRSILLTTYRHGKLLIGPGRSFVRAGSLASCYTTPSQNLQQLTDMVASILRNKNLPRPQYPRSFQVEINSQVAESLGLNVPDEQTITARLQNQTSQISSKECGNGC